MNYTDVPSPPRVTVEDLSKVDWAYKYPVALSDLQKGDYVTMFDPYDHSETVRVLTDIERDANGLCPKTPSLTQKVRGFWVNGRGFGSTSQTFGDR